MRASGVPVQLTLNVAVLLVCAPPKVSIWPKFMAETPKEQFCAWTTVGRAIPARPRIKIA
ncbi:hypothetical protein A7J42_16435 [Brucella intermedia]|nr:hypothetical protein A7J42_16435 [Brucella intermedia]